LGWQSGSNGSTSAQQAWGPEFKPHYHKKKRKKKMGSYITLFLSKKIAQIINLRIR
jgi:hypothetical protein